MHIFTAARLLKWLSWLASINAIITWEKTFQKCLPWSRHHAEQVNFRTTRTLISRFCQCRILKTSFQFSKPHEWYTVHNLKCSLFCSRFQIPVCHKAISKHSNLPKVHPLLTGESAPLPPWHHWGSYTLTKILGSHLNLGPPWYQSSRSPLNLSVRTFSYFGPTCQYMCRTPYTCVALKQFNLLPPNILFSSNFIYYPLTHQFEAITLGWIKTCQMILRPTNWDLSHK